MEHKDIDIVEEIAAAPKPPPPPPLVAARTTATDFGVGKFLVFLGKKLRVFNLDDLLRGSAEAWFSIWMICLGVGVGIAFLFCMSMEF